MLPFSKTQIIEYLVDLGVASVATKYSYKIITDNTNVNPDGITVKFGSAVIGNLVSAKTKPYTDRLVETTITRYQDWKTSKSATN